MSSETSSDNPYPGPRPFQIKEKEKFFGRDEEKEDLATLISAHRLVFLYAESGMGKTSLLNASLIPTLDQQGFDVLPVVRVGDPLPPELNLSPDEIRNIFVLNTLLSWRGEALDAHSLLQRSISEFLERRESSAKPRVIIFDQFEELFTSYPERWRERADFFIQLAKTMEEALIKNQGLRVLFVLREDYLAILDSYVELLPEGPGIGYRLERMRREAAHLAIERPLEKTRRRFADGVALNLVDRLLQVPIDSPYVSQKDVLGEFVEPVHLQIVCHTLWEKLPDNAHEITIKHLKLLGDINKPLADFYDEAIKKVAEQTKVKEEKIRNWFEQHLITPAKTRGTVFAGTTETGGLTNDAVQLLDKMYLIKSEWRANARWYELTHDRFIEPILQSNQKWREKRIKFEEKGRGQLAFFRMIGCGAFALAVFSGTILGIAPPAETNASFLIIIASFLTLIILLISATLLKRSGSRAQKIIWWSLAVIFLVASILFFFSYKQSRGQLTFRFPFTDEYFVKGTQLTPSAEEFLRTQPAMTTDQLILAFGGDPEQVWTLASIKASSRILMINYLCFILSLACCLFCLWEGLSLIASSQRAATTYLSDNLLPFESSALGLYLIVFTTLLIYLCYKLWPTDLLDASGNKVLTAYGTVAWDPKISFLGGFFESFIHPEKRVFLLVILVGALGSSIHAVTSFVDYVGNRHLKSSWIWSFIARPFIGMSLALICYLVLRAGFIAPNINVDTLNLFGIASLAALAGLFSKQATDKLSEVFTALFAPAPGGDTKRTDMLASQAPLIMSIDPKRGPVDGGTVVTILGSGFTPGTAITFGGRLAKSVSAISSTSIVATTPAHPSGGVDVEVVKPDGDKAIIREGFTFEEKN